MRRFALLIATENFADSELGHLPSAGRDLAALAEVLREQGFDEVRSCLDANESELRVAVAEILDGRDRYDVVLLYISTHGLLDAAGKLYFAAAGTRPRLLSATGLDARWVDERMQDSYAGGRVVVLDCCFSGAYGFNRKSGGVDPVEGRLGTGYIVLTASSDLDFAYQGDDGGVSVFTAALIEGVRTGRADLDRDGWISAHDWYGYAAAAVRGRNGQRPRYYAMQEGDVRLFQTTAMPVRDDDGLSDGCRRLLMSQADDAGKHRYQFFVDGHVPASRNLYVEQRAETSPAPLVTGEAGVPGLLTMREILTRPREFPSVLLVGGPGMGKSTLVSQIVHEQSRWWLTPAAERGDAGPPFGAVVPVALPARLLVGRTLPAALAEVCAPAGADLVHEIVDRPPALGATWLVLVDGVDEVLRATERSEVISVLATWLARSPATHRFLITTRPLSYGELPELRSQRVGEFALQPFGPDDVREFATKLFGARRAERDAVRSAGLFQRRIATARLGSVVSVPLLTTIAALVFESNRDGDLPADRAGLYERFVEHLLYGRQDATGQQDRLRAEFRRYGAGAERAFDWLADRRRDLIEHLADRQLAGLAPSLLDEATGWVAAECPEPAMTSTPGWRRSVRDLLVSTGLLAPSSGDLVFTHRSLAEYLAAGPRGAHLDVEDWLVQARAPDTRNLALFVLARSLEPAEPLVRTLLANAGEDVIVAGDVLADGIEVGATTRDRVTDKLFEQLTDEDPAAPEALRVLTALAADRAVAARLERLVRDAGSRPWVRLLVADALGPEGLREVAESVALDPVALSWANQQLVRRGAQPVSAAGSGEASGGSLARFAYREALANTPPGTPQFLGYAMALADAGDPAGRDALAACAEDPRFGADLRARAERALGRVDHVPERRPDPRADLAVIRGGLPNRNPDFTGREKLLLQMARLFERGHRLALLPRTLLGLGGVGKTQLAIEYVYRYADRYDLIWWIPAQQHSVALASLKKLADQLGLPASQNLDLTADMLADALASSTMRWLLVFDNAEEPEDIARMLPSAGGHLIVTSRNHVWTETWPAIEVDVFDRPESIALISRHGDRSEAEADRLAEAVGDLPLAVAQTLTWLASTNMPTDEYLELLQRHLEEVLWDGRPAGGVPATVMSFFGLAHSLLRERTPEGADLLALFTYLAPEPISLSLFRRGRTASLSGALRQALNDPIRLNRTVRELRRAGLATVDADQRVQVHRLVLYALRERFTAEASQHHLHEARNLLAEANPGYPDDPGTWPVYAQLAPHATAADLIHGDPAARQLVIDLISYLGNTGDYEGARRLAEPAIEAWAGSDEPDLGPDGEQTLLALARLGTVLRGLGRYERARELTTDVLGRFEQSFGPEHEHALAAAAGLGYDLRLAGDYPAAFEVDQRTLTKHRLIFLENDPETLRIRSNLAVSLRALGDFRGAWEIDSGVAEAWENMVGGADPRVLFCRANLARDLLGLGRYTEAFELAESALAQYRFAPGSGQASALLVERTLAIACRKIGRVADALRIARESYRSTHASFGPDHEHTLATSMTYANTLRSVGEAVAARSLGAEAVDRYRRVFGEDHPLTCAARVNLAIVDRALGDAVPGPDESVLRTLQDRLGPDHPYSLAAANGLANDLASDDQTEEARRLSEETLGISRRALGEDHPDTVRCHVNALLDLGMPPDEPVARLSDILGPEHPDVIHARRGRRTEWDVEPPPH